MSQNVSSDRIPTFSLGERIRKARKDHGNASQESFAAELGVDRKTLNNWENARHKPSRGDLMLISSVSDVSFAWLLGDEGDVAGAAETPRPRTPSTDARSTKSSGRCTQSDVASRSLSVDQYALVPA